MNMIIVSRNWFSKKGMWAGSRNETLIWCGLREPFIVKLLPFCRLFNLLLVHLHEIVYS